MRSCGDRSVAAFLAPGSEPYAEPVGKLIYKGGGQPIEIEDRTLAHLRLVFMTKLRRGEPFSFETQSRMSTHRVDLWVHPSLPLQFHFTGSRPPKINHRWIEVLMDSANSADGLRVVPEPQY